MSKQNLDTLYRTVDSIVLGFDRPTKPVEGLVVEQNNIATVV